MKTIDLSKPVMQRVVAYEKKRTWLWILLFFLLLFCAGVLAGMSLWVATQDVASRQTLDLLSLFGENWEIIAEYWQDTASVVWEELPKETLTLALLGITALVVLIVATRHKRRIIRKKLSTLEKYGKNRNNRT